MSGTKTVEFLRRDVDPEDILPELQRLVLSYQYANYDDRTAVWAILNKYAKYVDGLDQAE